MKKLLRTLLKYMGTVIPSLIGNFISNLFLGKIKEQIKDKVTDKFVELLLYGMDLYVCLSRSFRSNLKGYHGKILLETKGGEIQAGAHFFDGDMKVIRTRFEDWDARVRFVNSEALRNFLFSKDRDILNALLKNQIEVDGNLNHIYKFSFLAREIAYSLKVL